ncbi:MAG TPA: hypothetical protein VK177_12185 [Flavobacteriales bacterium]|nr:hypothetical protein [Flavobacteriales bacterium]
MKYVTTLVAAFVIFLTACHSPEQAMMLPSVDNNVCKKLNGKVVIYAVFVDTKHTQPWSEYDIKSTLDSIDKAKCWIEKRAKENGIGLSVDVQSHVNKKMVPISMDLPGKTLSGTLLSPTLQIGITRVNKWADKVAKLAAQSLKKETSEIIKTKNTLRDRERLIARVRDINSTDNVVLMYFINNYYKEELSVSIDCSSRTDVEYAVVSFKNPSVIAHEFLHIFGALDLYISPFDSDRKNKRRKEMAMKMFPDEIMAFAYRSIDSLNVSPLTKYLIGWDNELDKKYKDLLFGKKLKVAKY